MTKRYTDQEIDAILSRAEKIAGQVGRLQEKLRQVQADNRRLRRLNDLRRPARLIHKATESARKLAAVGLAGYALTREAAYSVGGIGERSFFYGRAMLELAEVTADGLLLISDPLEIEARLSQAAKAAAEDIYLLWRRIAPSRRPKLGADARV